MFRLLIISTLLVGSTLAADCVSKNGVKCLKKSDLPAGFGAMMLGGDPCFMFKDARVSERG